MAKHDSGKTSNPKDDYKGKHDSDAAGTAQQRKELEQKLRQQNKVK